MSVTSASPAGLPSTYECKLLLRHLIREDRDGQFFFESHGSDESLGSIEDELFGGTCSPEDFVRKTRGLLKAAATAEIVPRRREALRLLRMFETALPLISRAEEQAKHADIRLGVADTYYEKSTERSAKEVFTGESSINWEVDILFERFTFAGPAYSASGQPLPDQSSRVRSYIYLRLREIVKRMKKRSEKISDTAFTLMMSLTLTPHIYSLESKGTHRSPKTFHARGTAASFSLSQPVMARYRGMGDFFAGKIVKVHQDDKYDIHYDDGDTDLCLSAGLIKPLPPSGKRGRGRPRKNSPALGPAQKVQRKGGKNLGKPSACSSSKKPGRLLRQLGERTAMFPFTEVFSSGLGNTVIRFEGPAPSPGLSSLPDKTKIEALGQFVAMCIHEEKGSMGTRIYGKRCGFCPCFS